MGGLRGIWVDPRQAVAGFLTITMFVMLADMIKRDYLDPPDGIGVPAVSRTDVEQMEKSFVTLSGSQRSPWLENESNLNPCWSIASLAETEPSASKSFIIFSLTNGPEYHQYQVADAVMVARHLRATLVVPDIRGSRPGITWKFKDVYDIDKFITSLEGVVGLVTHIPPEVTSKDFAVVKVPSGVTREHISKVIEPVFKEKRNIRLATYFSSTETGIYGRGELDPVSCLPMFATLRFQPEIHEVADLMIARMRALGTKSGNSRFVAIDLSVGSWKSMRCRGKGGKIKCYDPIEIAVFLRKAGFENSTAVYLTQSTWDDSLDALKVFFPNIYVKGELIPAGREGKYVSSEASVFEVAVDMHICSQSDVFVPTVPGLFEGAVTGNRIISGKTQVLLPEITSSEGDYISPFISKKNHLAYSCFC